jgi:hypothetical protein
MLLLPSFTACLCGFVFGLRYAAIIKAATIATPAPARVPPPMTTTTTSTTPPNQADSQPSVPGTLLIQLPGALPGSTTTTAETETPGDERPGSWFNRTWGSDSPICTCCTPGTSLMYISLGADSGGLKGSFLLFSALSPLSSSSQRMAGYLRFSRGCIRIGVSFRVLSCPRNGVVSYEKTDPKQSRRSL